MKEIDVWESTEEEAEHDLDRAATLVQDHALLVEDRLLRLALVDLVVRHRNGDHRDHHCHSDLAVAPRNVDHEAAASLLAGTFVILKRIHDVCCSLIHQISFDILQI